jgi:two-component system chemotaxis response regulator CheB
MVEKKLLDFTCPECRGPVHMLTEEGPPVFRCRIGHAYSVRTFLQQHGETQERQLWAAAVALDEAASIAAEAAETLPQLREQLLASGLEKQRQADAVKAIIAELKPFPVE